MKALLAAELVLLTACSTRPGYQSSLLSSDAPQVEDEGYRKSLDRFTRWETRYDELDSRVFLAATWQAWPLRRARVSALAEIQRFTPAQAAAMLAREIFEARRYTDIFLGLYTAENRWNDLSSPHSIWHLELEGGPAGPVEPIVVERIGRPDANLRALYPYLTPFWVGYRLRFPGPPPEAPPGSLVLRMSSTVAQVDARWETAGVEPPPPEETPAPEPGPSP